jgi:hypothetical protein
MTWRPQPGPQEAAIRASFVDELFFGGARGGGKSELLLGDYLSDVDTYGEHWSGVLIRRTYPELDEILERSRQIFRAAYPDAEYKVGRHEWIFKNGATLKLRHLENEADADHFQGQQYTWIGWDELTSWSDMKAYHKLKACLRTGAAEIPTKRIRASGNPGGPNHNNVKAYFIDAAPESTIVEGDDGMKRMYIRSLVTDNKILLERDPGYIKRLEGVGDEQLVKAWLEGDWDSFVGQYFTNWNEDKVAVPSFEIPDHWPLFGGLDYGEAAPTSYGLYTVDYDSNVYRICEYYQANATASQHAANIAQMIEACPFTSGRYPQATYADPSMFVKRRLSEVINHSPADVFAEQGIFLTRANNDRVTGWRVVNDALIKERIYLFNGWNDALMRTMPALPRSSKNPEDLDTTAEDHAADELRYAMMHVYKPHQVKEPEPYEGTGQEVIDQLENGSGRRSGRYAYAS